MDVKNEDNNGLLAGVGKRLTLSVNRKTKKYVLYGSHNNKDAKVVINNVTVSFLCLKAAAQWRWG